MTKSKVFVFIAISFAVGVLAASAFDIPAVDVYLFLGLAAAGFAMFYFNNFRIGIFLCLFLFALGLGALRLQLSMAPNQYAATLDGDKQQFEGYVVEDVSTTPTGQSITFRPDGFSQNILINTNLAQQFFYGDRLAVTGKIESVKNYSDFDYASYLQRFNVYAAMSYPTMLILKSHQLNPIKEFLLKIKAGFIAQTENLLPEPQSSLLVGILIGGHANLPQSVVNNFNTTGVSHIIAVSGFNITIIITALASLAYVIGRRASFWLASATILSFVIITGASASVVRAAVMGFLLLISFRLGRQYAIVPSLFFAGLIMLVINPKILFWDVGFQLSFAATLGIIYFFPVLEKLGHKIPELLGAKTLVLTTTSAILATLPLILLNFNTLSLSAPIVNVLVLPVVPFAMLFGFFVVIPFLGTGFAFLANWILLYMLKVIAFFAGLPYSALSFGISAWLFWTLAAVVFGLYFLLKYISNKTSKAFEPIRVL